MQPRSHQGGRPTFLFLLSLRLTFLSRATVRTDFTSGRICIFFNSSTVLDRRAPSQYATSCDMIGSQPNRSKAIRAALYVYGNNAMVRYERNASKGACTTTLPVLWKTKQELAKLRSYSLFLDTEASGRPTDNRHNKTQDWRSRILSRTQ